MKRYGAHMDQILIALDPQEEELKPGEDYRLVVWLTMIQEDWEDESKRSHASEGQVKLEEQLEALEGIEVLDCRLKSEADITLDDLRGLRPWDYDYLTHRLGATSGS